LLTGQLVILPLSYVALRRCSGLSAQAIAGSLLKPVAAMLVGVAVTLAAGMAMNHDRNVIIAAVVCLSVGGASYLLTLMLTMPHTLLSNINLLPRAVSRPVGRFLTRLVGTR
jgi:hypothetical protein